MLKLLWAALAIPLFGSLLSLHAQAIPAATGPGRLQLGATYSNGNTDEVTRRIGGISFYGTYDFHHHLGVEADIRLLEFHTPQDYAERSYLVGLRYSHVYGHLQPYAKVLGGLGNTVDQAAYVDREAEHWAVFGLGGGLDYHLPYGINLRIVDVEQQFWPHFQPNGLTPLVVSIGAAYRFH